MWWLYIAVGLLFVSGIMNIILSISLRRAHQFSKETLDQWAGSLDELQHAFEAYDHTKCSECSCKSVN